jgi:hypothetical protein
MGCPAQKRFNVALEVRASLYQTSAVLFHFFLRLARSTIVNPSLEALTESAIFIFCQNLAFVSFVSFVSVLHGRKLRQMVRCFAFAVQAF